MIKKYWGTIGQDNWVFKDNNGNKLIKYAQTRIIRHVKVKGESSPYDGDFIYWSRRTREHPEIPQRVTKLLKVQEGKCAHCGLYFLDSDLMEVDHIIPKSKGGKDEYKNWQLLHRHCHDRKTITDIKGIHDKEQVIEEPDEAKVSRPVLKPSRKGDLPA